jgi:hypothetical protein
MEEGGREEWYVCRYAVSMGFPEGVELSRVYQFQKKRSRQGRWAGRQALSNLSRRPNEYLYEMEPLNFPTYLPDWVNDYYYPTSSLN